MAKISFYALAFAVVCTTSMVCATAAMADPATDGRQEITVSHPHNYWLSDGLNRLVFWQSPLQTGRSVAKSPEGNVKK